MFFFDCAKGIKKKQREGGDERRRTKLFLLILTPHLETNFEEKRRRGASERGGKSLDSKRPYVFFYTHTYV